MRADLYPLQVLLVALAGWVNRDQQRLIEYPSRLGVAWRALPASPPERTPADEWIHSHDVW